MKEIVIRRFDEKDAEIASQIICRNFLEVNIIDYDIEWMKELCTFNTPDKLIEKSKVRHSYVALSEGMIVGTGSIGVEDKVDVSMIHSVFILPELQGQGIGKKIMDVLESDEFFLKSNLVKVCASKTALDFYLKMGYDYEYGEPRLIDDDYWPVVKRR